MDATLGDALERVIHEPEMYAHHCQGLVIMMERVMRIASISHKCVKLSSWEMEIRPYYISRTTVLAVMPIQECQIFRGRWSLV